MIGALFTFTSCFCQLPEGLFLLSEVSAKSYGSFKNNFEFYRGAAFQKGSTSPNLIWSEPLV
jgi:hypothetical protein